MGRMYSNFTRSTEVIPYENLNVSEPDGGYLARSPAAGFTLAMLILSMQTNGNFTESVITNGAGKSWILHWIDRSIRTMEPVIDGGLFICNDLQIRWSVGIRKPIRTEPWTRYPSICTCSMVQVETTLIWMDVQAMDLQAVGPQATDLQAMDLRVVYLPGWFA